MTRNPERPLSPHLQIWRWGPAMLISILHRASGIALTVVGLALLAWWLCALATGGAHFDTFVETMNHWAGIVVLLGLTWAFWQHLLSGIRHLVLDIGAGYELRTNRFFSILIVVGSIFLTALTWAIGTGAIA
jgi:succinate dehydrogenase / fumarate reductase cytochrome b subunit